MLNNIDKINFQFSTDVKISTTVFLNMIFAINTLEVLVFINSCLCDTLIGNRYYNINFLNCLSN